MTMISVYYKEQEGLTRMGSVPWWSGLVTGSTLQESIRTKPYGSKLTQITPKPSDHDADQVLDKSDVTQFNIFTGGNLVGKLDQSASDSQDCNNSSNTQKPTKFQADYATMLCGKYPFRDQCYGVLSTYGPQITGRIMLPLNLSSDDGPIFVNAKQYHAILRRRRCRAKAEMASKVLKNRKPYLHHSRHLHAMRRPRGNGGRFLNTKKENNCQDENTNTEKVENPLESPNYVIFMSNHNNSTSPQEPNNMFFMRDLKSLPIGNLSVVSFSEMMSRNIVPGHSFEMHNKWDATANTGSGGGRCSFAV